MGPKLKNLFLLSDIWGLNKKTWLAKDKNKGVTVSFCK